MSMDRGIKPSLEKQGVESHTHKHTHKATRNYYYSIQVTKKDKTHLSISWPGPTTFIIFKGASWGPLGWDKEKSLKHPELANLKRWWVDLRIDPVKFYCMEDIDH